MLIIQNKRPVTEKEEEENSNLEKALKRETLRRMNSKKVAREKIIGIHMKTLTCQIEVLLDKDKVWSYLPRKKLIPIT